MLTVTVDRAQKYGVVKTQNNLVKAILEKPKGEEIGKVVNAGVYSFSPLIFKFLESMDISERGEYEITDALRVMIGRRLFRQVSAHERHLDGRALPLESAGHERGHDEEKKAEIRGKVEEGAHIIGAVTSARIR